MHAKAGRKRIFGFFWFFLKASRLHLLKFVPPSSPSPGPPRRALAVEAASKTQLSTVKLSDTQLVVLTAAARREDGLLLPFPKSLTAKRAQKSAIVKV
jgi:hypothetical protein